MRVNLFSSLLALFFAWSAVVAQNAGWDSAHVTFYGDETSHGGACGYQHNEIDPYNAALSTVLFNNGLTCGACYQLVCADDAQWCVPGASVFVTATNFCPPSNAAPYWCNPPYKHFDLSLVAFSKIVKAPRAGIAPVRFRRVPCFKQGGIRFTLGGNNFWLLVLVSNVAGAGDVHGLWIKGSRTNWIEMTRNWGQNWQTNEKLEGQSLSFRVMTSDGKTVVMESIAPANWQRGVTYEGNQI